MQTAERVSGRDMSDNFVFRRSILAYHKAAEIVSGDVLETRAGLVSRNPVTIHSGDTHTSFSGIFPQPFNLHILGKLVCLCHPAVHRHSYLSIHLRSSHPFKAYSLAAARISGVQLSALERSVHRLTV